MSGEGVAAIPLLFKCTCDTIYLTETFRLVPGGVVSRRASKSLRCRFHLHRWGKQFLVPVHHLGEYPWQRFQHICHAQARECVRCGKLKRRQLRSRCASGVMVRLPPQPHCVSSAELQAACKALMSAPVART